MILAETFGELISDPNHWMFETVAALIENVIILGIAWPLVKRAIVNHDKKHHPKD